MVLRHSEIAVINVACQEADTASVTEARHAIGRARDTPEEAYTDDDLGGIFACGGVRLANYSAGVFLKTGKPDAALQAADAAYPAAGQGVGARGAHGLPGGHVALFSTSQPLTRSPARRSGDL